MRTSHRGRPRAGLTLVEVILSLVILAASLAWMTQFVALFTHTTKSTSSQMRALDLISNRIDTVRQAPAYTAIDTMVATQTIALDSTTYTRNTMVLHVGGGYTDTVDYKIVTVQVTQPSLAQPVRKTTFIASF
jgi:prepilin-type N-terminal cleavage/methylation domain-containing protein